MTLKLIHRSHKFTDNPKDAGGPVLIEDDPDYQAPADLDPDALMNVKPHDNEASVHRQSFELDGLSDATPDFLNFPDPLFDQDW